MIYLNQAATTYPKPQCVLDAYTAAFTHPPAGQYRSSSGGKDAKEACRKSLGKLLGIQETDRIFFSSGATDSSNALIYGLPSLREKNSSGQPNRAQQYSASADEFKRPGGTGSGHSL